MPFHPTYTLPKLTDINDNNVVSSRLKPLQRKKIEEIELNCPWTMSVPSGAGHDLKTTKQRW